MRIQPKDLSLHLTRGLASIYFIWGEEPLQRIEALDAIRAAAKKQGFLEREVIELTSVKDDDALHAILNTPSLFTQKRLIECRLKEVKNTKIMQEILMNALLKLPPDILFVIFYPDKLDSTTMKNAWFVTLERMAITVVSNPIPQNKFTHWLQERAKQQGIPLTPEALSYVAERTEGNLVAAHQTLEKIALLQTCALPQLTKVMIWENRHSVFELGDALLQGAYTRTFRILDSLKNEGIEPSLVCWAITREVRNLIPLAETLEKEGRLNDAMMEAFRVWKQRRQLVSSFLQKCPLPTLYDIFARAKNVDTCIKTEPLKKTWQALQDLCHHFCCLGAHP